MPNFTGSVISGQPAFSSSSTPLHKIGQQAVCGDGRKYRYVLAGAAAPVVGNALQAPVEDTDHDDITVRATAAGDTALLITTGSGAGALDANEYAEGYAVIDTTPGLGYIYKISDHAAIAATTNGALNLYKEDAIQVALTASSKVTLVQNPYRKVIQAPVTTDTNVCVGGAIYPITLAEYGWIQTGGPGAALIDQTPAAGQPLTSRASAAGSLAVHSAELNHVADMMVTGRNGKVLPVFWRCDS